MQFSLGYTEQIKYFPFTIFLIKWTFNGRASHLSGFPLRREVLLLRHWVTLPNIFALTDLRLCYELDCYHDSGSNSVGSRDEAPLHCWQDNSPLSYFKVGIHFCNTAGLFNFEKQLLPKQPDLDWQKQGNPGSINHLPPLDLATRHARVITPKYQLVFTLSVPTAEGRVHESACSVSTEWDRDPESWQCKHKLVLWRDWRFVVLCLDTLKMGTLARTEEAEIRTALIWLLLSSSRLR